MAIVHIPRQPGQATLHVGQCLRLEASADFLQCVDEPGHFVGPDLAVQRQPIEPRHLAPHTHRYRWTLNYGTHSDTMPRAPTPYYARPSRSRMRCTVRQGMLWPRFAARGSCE